jgi:prephenate dehydrogenase
MKMERQQFPRSECVNKGEEIAIGIVGCGLIGASIVASVAHAFPAAGFRLFDTNERNLSYISANFASAERHEIEGLADCDFIFVCTPVSVISNYVTRLAALADTGKTTIIDAGSVKSTVIEALGPNAPANFVPGHPLAGGYISGPEGGSRDVIEGRHFVLTPTDATDPAHLARAVDFLETLGAAVIRLDPRTHDHLLAVTSHIPHIVSFALVDLLAAAEASVPSISADELVVRSFRTVTMFAQSDPRMWSDIFTHNKREIRGTIRSLISVLEEYDRLIEDRDAEPLTSRLHAAAERRKRLKGDSYD